MKKQIRVSYIIPTINRAKFLKKTLLNVREFITKQDELIVIDGGSKDNTKGVVVQNMDLIAYFESEKNLGEAHALNKGILNSSGKYIKCLTHDDYIFPKAMKKAIQIMEENEEIDALQCGGESWVYNEKTKKEEVRFYEQVFPNVKIAHDLLHVTKYCPCGLGLILRRRIISKTGLFDTSFLAADLYMISKIIQCQLNFKYLNINLFKHTQYSHSGSNNSDKIHYDEARVYLTHRMWEKIFSINTNILTRVFGLEQTKYGKALIRSIKLLDFLRRKKIYFPINFLDFIARQRFLPKKIKQKFFPKSQISIPSPIPPLRDNKFW